jgi:uncharacterized protein (TIGR02118 family)
MIRVSVLYPHSAGARFDMDYYLNRHIPMVRDKLGSACKGVTVEQGLSGGGPGTAPAYEVLAHVLFESVQAFQAAFAPHANAIMADMPNYTEIQPITQISDVKLQ